MSEPGEIKISQADIASHRPIRIAKSDLGIRVTDADLGRIKISQEDLRREREKTAGELSRTQDPIPPVTPSPAPETGNIKMSLEQVRSATPFNAVSAEESKARSEIQRVDRERFLTNQLREIEGRNDLPGDNEQSNPVKMPTHFSQEQRGEHGRYTCVAASIRNALYALGVDEPYTDERSIVESLGGNSAFDRRTGFIRPNGIRQYLQSRGLDAEGTTAFTDLTDVLIKGGVGILSYGSHARLVSGIEKTSQGIFLRVNDPFRERMERVPLRRVINEINGEGYSIFTLNNRPHQRNS